MMYWITALIRIFFPKQTRMPSLPKEQRKKATCQYDHLMREARPAVTEQRAAREIFGQVNEIQVNALKSEAMLGLIKSETTEWEKEAHENQWERLSREAHRVILNKREMREDRMRKASEKGTDLRDGRLSAE